MSKLLVFGFACQRCGHEFDDLVHSDVHKLPCPLCGKVSKRQVSTPRFDIRMGLDPTGNPTMAAKWKRQHEQSARIEVQRERDNGPDAWGAAGADVRR